MFKKMLLCHSKGNVCMQSTTISNYQPVFGQIYTGQNVKNLLCSPDRTKSFEHKFVNVKKFLHKQHYAKAEHVDTVIDYSENNGFYLWIKNKHGVIPCAQKSPYFRNIARTEKCINELTEWINYWNSVCGDLH